MAAHHQRKALPVDRHARDEALDQFRLHAAVEAGGRPTEIAVASAFRSSPAKPRFMAS
jgi:hypothetical protein